MRSALLLVMATCFCSTLQAVPHEDVIVKWANVYGVPIWLAKRVAEVESGFDASAVSPEGSRGLFQISKYWQKELAWFAGVKRFRWWNADDSAHVGLAYLARLRRYYGNWGSAIAAYNCGPGRFDSARALPSETIEYLRRIFHDSGRF